MSDNIEPATDEQIEWWRNNEPTQYDCCYQVRSLCARIDAERQRREAAELAIRQFLDWYDVDGINDGGEAMIHMMRETLAAADAAKGEE